MEAKELRLGNLVMHTVRNKQYKVCQLSANSISVYPCKFINPISLTVEILIRCGFEISDMEDMGMHTFIKIDHDLYLSLHDGEIWIGEYNTHIKYLHQLQNLYYALTGKELILTF